MSEEAHPFFRLFPAYSETTCGKSLCKIRLFGVGYINSQTFFRFFRKSILGSPERASRRNGKIAGDNAA